MVMNRFRKNREITSFSNEIKKMRCFAFATTSNENFIHTFDQFRKKLFIVNWIWNAILQLKTVKSAQRVWLMWLYDWLFVIKHKCMGHAMCSYSVHGCMHYENRWNNEIDTSRVMWWAKAFQSITVYHRVLVLFIRIFFVQHVSCLHL